MITRPMLAATCEDVCTLEFPLMVTPKLDGIRCLKIAGRAVSRNFKPITNTYIRESIEAHLPDGVDGELIVEGVRFGEGGINREDGQPNFKFCIFDYVLDRLTKPYVERMIDLVRLPDLAFVEKIVPATVFNVEQLKQFEETALAQGYEGVIARSPESIYKTGRSTGNSRDSLLTKIKRFADSEAEIIEVYEKMSNQNEATLDAFGHTKRSTSQEGLVPLGTAGSMLVRDIYTKVEFCIGAGAGDAQVAAWIWEHRTEVPGRIIKYKYQPSGMKDKPRFPVNLGFRLGSDMDAKGAKDARVLQD